MEWDLSTIEHHGSCPWGQHCQILTWETQTREIRKADPDYHPEDKDQICVWCFVLAQAEWQKEMFNTISENMSDEIAMMKTDRKAIDIDRRRQPQTKWDQYGF